MKITYWSDYACPYCYIGEARLKKVLASAPELRDVEVEMKSFQLDPTAGEHAVGDEEGTKPRKVLMNKQQFEEYVNGTKEEI